MAGGDDLKAHATSSEDFYGLLEVPPTVNEAEIRRAYRRTALKYHPDKVGASDATLDKFHLLQIAHDVLSDQELRQLYDNARRAREEKKARVAACGSHRRHLFEDLERREREGLAKRKREAGEVDDFQRELNRLAEDGRRRTREREAKLRREAQAEFERYQTELEGNSLSSEQTSVHPNTDASTVTATDRQILLRFPKGILDQGDLFALFNRFGQIEEVIVQTKTKKKKVEGEKHRREYCVALIEFKSLVSAHAAVTDWPDLAKSDAEKWGLFETVRWFAGKEPDCLPKPATAAENATITRDVPEREPLTEMPKSTLSSDEALMIRLKNGERLRQSRKRQKEAAAAAATTASEENLEPLPANP